MQHVFGSKKIKCVSKSKSKDFFLKKILLDTCPFLGQLMPLF